MSYPMGSYTLHEQQHAFFCKEKALSVLLVLSVSCHSNDLCCQRLQGLLISQNRLSNRHAEQVEGRADSSPG